MDFWTLRRATIAFGSTQASHTERSGNPCYRTASKVSQHPFVFEMALSTLFFGRDMNPSVFHSRNWKTIFYGCWICGGDNVTGAGRAACGGTGGGGFHSCFPACWPMLLFVRLDSDLILRFLFVHLIHVVANAIINVTD